MGAISLRARPFVQLALIALLVPVAPIIGVSTAIADPVGPQSVLQCASSVPIYVVRANGELWLHQHLEPESGLNSWATPRQIGEGWNIGHSFAGPDGTIYLVVDNGPLRRYRWNGTSWDIFAGGAKFEVIDPDPVWARHAARIGTITADTNGHIYTMEDDGNIHWRAYDSTTRTWIHRVIDSSSNDSHWIGNPMVAAGDGVLYQHYNAVNGAPYRFRYHATSQRALEPLSAVSSQGVRWNDIRHVLSPGGDLLYGVRWRDVLTNPDGDLMWFRYNEDTDTLSSSVITVGGWLNHHSIFAAPDACQRVGTVVPTRPQVTPQSRAPVTLMRSSNGHVHYSYVDADGRAVYAEAADLTGGSSLGAAVVPGLTAVTGITSTAENQDGRVQIVGHGLDAEIRNNVKAAVSGPWGATTTLGGFVGSPASIVRLPDNTLNIIAVDSTGGLWLRRQIGINGTFAAWIKVGDSPLGTGPLAVVPISNGHRIVGVSPTGTVHSAILWNDGLVSNWRSLSGSGFHAETSAVALSDGMLQVFVTGLDGVVRTQRQTSNGFPGTWTTISGVVASGRPSAIVAPDGTVRIVVRATDGYVYYTGQAAPGSPAFNPWQEITNYSEQSSTDPTALAVPESNTWVIAYRTDIDVPRLRRHQPAAPSDAATAFTALSLAAPAS